jgi:hypothetical protein
LNGLAASSYGIDNIGSISRLRNAQGGDVSALTYRGNLPTHYEVIVNSSESYGQLEVGSTGSSQIMTVAASNLGGALTGQYAAVVSGVTPDQIANEGQITIGGQGMLSVLSTAAPRGGGLGLVWDLDVLNFGKDMAEPQKSFLMQNWLAVRQSLDYDLNTFDENGVGVALMGQYFSFDGGNAGGTNGELQGALIGAKRFNEQVRIGGFLNWRFEGDDINGINDVSRLPIFGAFVGFSQAEDGTGIQARISAAYEHGDADFSHANLLGGAVTASGEADFDTYGVAAEIGWGFAFAGQKVTPFIGLNYVNSTREDYRDGNGNGSVLDPFSFSSFSEACATSTLGIRLNGPVTGKFSYRLSVGLESVLNDDADEFGLSGAFGSTSYRSQAGISACSLNSSAGLSYLLSDCQSLTLDGFLRQMEGGMNYSGSSIGYKKGF